MGYCASFNGTLSPRDGAAEGAITLALVEILPGDYYEQKENGKTISYEISGKEKYYEEDYDELAKVFDGQVNFVGDDYARWSLFLKDGKARESTPIEVLPKPDETNEQAIGRYIAESGLNIRQILESMPDFVAGKIWATEDVTSKKIKVSGITLLTKEEAKALPEELRVLGTGWWLRSPGNSQYYAAGVNYYGALYNYLVHFSPEGVRPALNLESSDLKIGDKIEMAGYKWTAISESKVLCDTIVNRICFRENVNTPDANDYEKSDIKKWLEKWAKDKGVMA